MTRMLRPQRAELPIDGGQLPIMRRNIPRRLLEPPRVTIHSSESTDLLIKLRKTETWKNLKIYLENGYDFEEVIKFFKKAKLTNLLYLLIDDATDEEHFLIPIIANQKFYKLVHLELHGMNDTQVKELLKAKIPLLQTLDLSKGHFTEEGIQSFRNIHLQFPYLKDLDLEDNDLGDEGIFELSRCNLQTIERLSLYDTGISSVGADYIRTMYLSNLRELDIGKNPIFTTGLRSLLRGNLCNRLEILYLDKNNLTDDIELNILVRLPRLKKLVLDYDDLVIQLPLLLVGCPNLEELHLVSFGEEFSGDVLCAILCVVNLPQLRSLYLKDIEITKIGIIMLLVFAKFPCLELLDLSGSTELEQVNEQGILETLLRRKFLRLNSLVFNN